MQCARLLRLLLPFGVVAAILGVGAAPAAAQQTGTIQGTVRDASSQDPIEGVQLQVVGTRIVAVSGQDGRYVLRNVPVGPAQIRVRMLGYSNQFATMTVAAGLATDQDFSMSESVIALDAVVVTGTGAAVEVKQLGNTIATLDIGKIENAPVQTFSEALAGREPSLVVSASSGLAGAGARIRIRGTNSLSMSNEPVVYVDGVRIDNGGSFIAAGQNAAEPSRLDDINPESISRVEVLKGAAAATLYGSEASGGVIQIFTHKGRAGAPRFSFRIEQGISQYPDVYHPNAGFARDAAQAADINELYGLSVAPYEVFQRTFVKDLFGTGHQQVYSGSVTGGGEDVNYFVSGRYSRDNGPLAAEHLGPARDVNRKIQGNASLTIFPRERLSFRISTLFTDTKHELPQNGNNIYGVVSLAMFGKPETAWCDDIDGDGAMDIDATQMTGETTPVCEVSGNPTGQRAFMTPREAMQQEASQSAEHFNASMTAAYQAAEGLDLEATFGLDATNARDFEFAAFGADVDDFTGHFPEGYRWVGSRNHREITLDLKGIWSTRFGNLSSQFTAGGQGFISTNKTTGGDGWDFPGPGLEVVEAAANQISYESWLQVVNTGLFAQEQIGFNDYAYFTVGGRWDKNSAFGENTGGAFYPKVSISVIPSDMSGWTSTTLSTFRVRAALGRSGLQPGAFDKFTTFGPGTTFEGPALRPQNLGNEDLAPERSLEWELGAEMGLFQNKLGIDVTYWNRTTTDALVRRQFPVTGGFLAQQLDNIGELKGEGLELKLDWLAVDLANVSVSMFATASYLKERITSMGTAPPIKVGGSYPRYRNFLRGPEDWDNDGDIDYFAPGAYFGGALVDYTPGSTVPFDTDGDKLPDSEATFRAYLSGTSSIDLSSSEMSPLLRDDDGDGDLLDTYQGKPYPDWTGSFGVAATLWRNLDINTLFEFKTGNFFVTNLTDAFRKSNSLIGRNTPEAAQVEATLANPATSEQERFDAAMRWATWLKGLAPHSGLNTMENARFLRLREVSLTYTAPRDFASKLGLGNLAVTLSGRNLIKWDGYTGIDQEMNAISRCVGSGTDCNFLESVDAFGLPLPRRYSLAVRFGF